MDYSKMSDFEINKRVAEVLCCTIHGYRNGNPIIDSITGKAFDPCNNPSDAWPIIMIMLDKGATLAINSDGVLSSNFGAKYKGFSFDVDDKPLRAACIVYLMMQEKQC